MRPYKICLKDKKLKKWSSRKRNPSTQRQKQNTNPTTTQSINQNGKDTSSRKEGSQDPKEGNWQETREESRVVLFVHLQGVETSPPQHWNLQERHVDLELFHQ